MIIAKIAVSVATYAIDKPYSYEVPVDLCEMVKPGVRVLVPFGRGNRKSEGIVLALSSSEKTRKGLKKVLAILDEQPVLDEKGIQLVLWLRERYFSTVYNAVLSMLPTGLWYTMRDCYKVAPGIGQEEAYKAAGQSRQAKRILEQIYASGGSLELSQLLNTVDVPNPKPQLNRLCKEGVLQLETGVQRKVKDKTEKVATLSIPPEEAMELVMKRRETAPMRYAVTQILSGLGSASVKEIRYFTGASMATIKSLEKSGILTLEEREVLRRAIPESSRDAAPPICLNEEQSLSLDHLKALAGEEKAEVALLYGVTGSGKTQVYLALIQHILEKGQTALVLVPEIALTAQLLEQFLRHFGEQVAILHSALPAGERYDEWKRIRDGSVHVVLGTRSAIFAPLKNLGLIVLDEEQEGSYQSENMLRYHARDVAKSRCAQEKALLLLGSATPAIETMYAAQTGRYHLIKLQKRYNEKALPSVLIVDMKEELRKGNHSGLSEKLCSELEENFSRGEQSILFLNRRGSSRMVSCGECGEVPSCPRCSVYLTYHGANGRLMCHHCGYSEPLAPLCTVCGGTLQFIGIGTQKIEEELGKRYPGIEVMRMDADAITAKTSHEVLLERFRRKKIPILLGTQMVSKGLDFENVTLVGVIAADLSLYVNHFRAAERTFSLLTQVVGRAGRGDKPGRAMIQTFTPNNEVITLAAQQDYDVFYRQECEMRKLFRYPPFGDLFRILVSGPEEAVILQICMNLRIGLERFAEEQTIGERAFDVLGPAPAGILKINNRYRYQMILKAMNSKEIRAGIAQLLRAAQSDPMTRGVSITADVNLLD